MDADAATSQPAAHNVGWGYGRISGNLAFILHPLFISLSFLSSSLSSFPRFPPSCCYLAPALVFSSPDTALRPALTFGALGVAYVSVAFVTFLLTLPLASPPLCEQPTDFPLLQMVGQQQLQRQPFPMGPSSGMQHNNMLSQFQNNGAVNQMTAPQLQPTFQQNRPSPAMLANLQPTQARQLELMMAQHQPPHNNHVASRLNQSQPVQQGFPQGMMGGNPNPGQPSQGKLLYHHLRPCLTCNFSQPRHYGPNVQCYDSGYKTCRITRIARSSSTPPCEHQSH